MVSNDRVGTQGSDFEYGVVEEDENIRFRGGEHDEVGIRDNFGDARLCDLTIEWCLMIAVGHTEADA